MPYPKGTPICKHYKYDSEHGWYCEILPGVTSRLECIHCSCCCEEKPQSLMTYIKDGKIVYYE